MWFLTSPCLVHLHIVRHSPSSGYICPVFLWDPLLYCTVFHASQSRISYFPVLVRFSVLVRSRLPSVSVRCLSRSLPFGCYHSANPFSFQPALTAQMMWKGAQFHVPVLVDLGTDGSYICTNLVRRLGIPTVAGVSLCTHGCPPWWGPLNYSPCQATFVQQIPRGTQLVMRSPRMPLVLDRPWLRKHNPLIDWTRGVIMGRLLPAMLPASGQPLALPTCPCQARSLLQTYLQSSLCVIT